MKRKRHLTKHSDFHHFCLLPFYGCLVFTWQIQTNEIGHNNDQLQCGATSADGHLVDLEPY